MYFSTRCGHIVPFIARIETGWKKKISHSGHVDKAPITNRLGGCAGARDGHNTGRHKNLTHVDQKVASYLTGRIDYTGSSSSDS